MYEPHCEQEHFSNGTVIVQVQVLSCHMHSNYSEAVVGDGILSCEASSSSAHTVQQSSGLQDEAVPEPGGEGLDANNLI